MLVVNNSLHRIALFQKRVLVGANGIEPVNPTD